MTVTLKPVTRDDIGALYRLRVAADQDGFVAPNEYSLAQVHYETGATPYVIWADEERVGFCQVIDMRAHEYCEPEDDPEALYLWRLMIGADCQGKGYGAAALRALMEKGRANGHVAMETSVVERNVMARKFYDCLGFTETGRVVDGELQLRLNL